MVIKQISVVMKFDIPSLLRNSVQPPSILSQRSSMGIFPGICGMWWQEIQEQGRSGISIGFEFASELVPWHPNAERRQTKQVRTRRLQPSMKSCTSQWVGSGLCEDYDSMTLAALKTKAQELGVVQSGTKKDSAQRVSATEIHGGLRIATHSMRTSQQFMARHAGSHRAPARCCST